MQQKNYRFIILFFAVVALIFPSAQSEIQAKNTQKPYLTCPILKKRTKDFLKYHYVFRSFDRKLSNRTYSNYLRFLDPGKLFFLQSDIEKFSKYKNVIGKKINLRDCSFISEIYEVYLERVKDSVGYAHKILESKLNFDVDEYLETDRKKLNWANSPAELEERWRKTIKFVVLNMRDVDSTSKITRRLKKRYSLIRKETAARTNDDIHSIFLNAFALSLDPHSSFLTPVDNAQFQIDFSLKLVGVGATLISPDGYTTVDAIVPGGAAALDGRLKKGDKIIAVDAGTGNGVEDVIDMSLDKVVQLIRGKEGSNVTLVIMRQNNDGDVQRLHLKLKRALVEIKENEAKSDVLKVKDKKIGIINLPSFYIDYKQCQKRPTTCRSSANDMFREISKLSKKGVDGIIIDLRRNGGGDLSEAERIVSYFIGNPVVTQVQDRDGSVHKLEMQSDPYYSGPLALLISRYTASASEIFAGAVQDYGRGLVVGDSRTFGKGTVQTVIDIPGTSGRQTNGAIHVTIAKFFRPSGKSNQEKGIKSDVVLPDPIDFFKIGEQDYDYALPYTTIKAAPNFRPIQNLSPIVPTLKMRSKKRISNLPEYKDLKEAINKARENQNTLVSLKETKKQKKNKKAKDKKTFDNSESQSQFSTEVINPKDYELKETANILLDGTSLLGRTNWGKEVNGRR